MVVMHTTAAQGHHISTLCVRLGPGPFYSRRGDDRYCRFYRKAAHSKCRDVRVSLYGWAFSGRGLTVLHGHPNSESFSWGPGQDYFPCERCIALARSPSVSVGC